MIHQTYFFNTPIEIKSEDLCIECEKTFLNQKSFIKNKGVNMKKNHLWIIEHKTNKDNIWYPLIENVCITRKSVRAVIDYYRNRNNDTIVFGSHYRYRKYEVR